MFNNIRLKISSFKNINKFQSTWSNFRNRKNIQVIQNIDQLANSTSKFRKIDIDALNVYFNNIDNINDLCPKYENKNIKISKEVYVSDLPASKLRYAIDDPSILENLDRNTKTFGQLIAYIIENEKVVRGTEESRTDAFVNHLLEKLEFGEYPLMIQPQSLLKFKVYDKEITSKYNFAIFKNRQVMLIDEDKHIKNTEPSSSWGEYQIAGEIIAGAYSNYSNSVLNYNENIYAVRVIGLRFTFYKAIINPEYIMSLGNGLPKSNIHIFRYPNITKYKDFPYLDYGNPEERKEIIDILIRLRENIILK